MLSLRAAVKTRRIRSLAVKFAVLGGIAIVLGFMGFIWLLPSQEVVLDRSADGIVVLTGGTSRVTDGLELLAAGRGKRLLITGVNPGTTTGDIAREVANYDRLLACCVDLDYSALNTLGNAVRRDAGPSIMVFIRSSSSPPPITCRGRSPNCRISFPMSR